MIASAGSPDIAAVVARSGTKSTTSALLAIDVRRLAREGVLRPGCTSTLGWPHPGGAVGASITIVARPVRLELRYAVDGESIDEPVPLGWTPGHFGGWRPWFRCPVAAAGAPRGRRVAKLYFDGSSTHVYALTTPTWRCALVHHERATVTRGSDDRLSKPAAARQR